LFIATISLPSATVDVVMSRIAGGPPATGTPIAIGFVDSRRSLPPNGATRCAPDVLRKCSDTCPASAAISAQSPSRPRCPQLRRPIIAMPFAFAFAMPMRVAVSPVTWPNPRCPSTIAIVSLSNATCGGVFGLSVPSRTQSTYLATRSTPCESWPTRFESTSRRATVRASSCDEPAPWTIAATRSTSFEAETVFMRASGTGRGRERAHLAARCAAPGLYTRDAGGMPGAGEPAMHALSSGTRLRAATIPL
jgi:hypothetical protein